MELLKGGAVQGPQQFLAMARALALRSGGCPVLAAAVEEPVECSAEPARSSAAEVFARWQGHLAAASLPTATNLLWRMGWPAW